MDLYLHTDMPDSLLHCWPQNTPKEFITVQHTQACPAPLLCGDSTSASGIDQISLNYETLQAKVSRGCVPAVICLQLRKSLQTYKDIT